MSLTGYQASYYLDSANSKKDYASLVGDEDCDVCIIGGGFTGLSAALHLAEKGYSVILLEAHKVAWGASGRNGGQVCQGHNMSHEDMIAKVGKESADLLWQMSLDSVDLVKDLIEKHQIQCDLKQGVLHVANKAKHCEELKQSVDYKQSKLNYQDIEYLDKAQVSAMLGSDKYHGGEYWKQGAHLHPLNYALGLAQAADNAGVKIFEDSRVTDYQTGNQVQVNTDKGCVKAKFVLLACNGYLGNLEPRIAGKIMPINNFILATEPLGDEICARINPQDVAVADSKFVINYFKLSADNRLLWGGGENYTSKFPSDIGQFVRKYMLEFYPELSQTKIDYGWGGTLAITLNRMPFFQRIEPNVLVAQGYSGHGVAMATLGGKLMAEAVAGQSHGFDVFAKMPSPSFPGGTLLRWPGLVAGMLYYSLRDRLF
ncbi:oxidoreductase [Marinomonas sp. S3726]|uniref:NAD(P)/FAD-dependent oxidoreductase n=1 Tax=Marinomonas sp. S3726 TaxID=579484 RepID=UPI0005FA8432|nr:FAD-binding oxidoreductase [Marinomonas sp. S3726]KJZ10838.1 oxidoreductase [Marinomonas sp. S3726]